MSRSESRSSVRPSSTLGNSGRPGSSLSHSSRASGSTTVPKTPKPSAARYGGLAEKDLQKITSSIRTATRTTTSYGRASARPLVDDMDLGIGTSDLLRPTPAPVPSGSFLSEQSFSHAPLRSRMPQLSPHRDVVHESILYDKDEQSSEGDVSLEELQEREQVTREREGLQKEDLRGLSNDLQEALVVEDLLFVLMGIEGQYIEYDPSYSPDDEYERLQGAKFVVDPTIDPWISSVVARILPVATYYTAIHAFVEQYSLLEHGVINHALCSAIRDMLREYLVLITQLEHQFNTSPTFTLQRMWFYLHPTLHTLSLLYSLTSTLVSLNIADPDDSDSDSEGSTNDGIGGEGLRDVLNGIRSGGAATTTKAWTTGVAKGGEVLAVLAERMERTSGDPTALQLYSTLLLRASQPYVGILLSWISSGHLSDPWEEFIVKEGKGRGLETDYTDEYWERRYTLRDKGSKKGAVGPGGVRESPRTRGLVAGAIVPDFLEPWKNKILLAGKYLNVIRECGIEIVIPASHQDGKDELIAMNEQSFYNRIDEAYTYANKILLKLLVQEQHLVSRLRSIKQYFFIDHGDSFSHFLDVAKHELNKKARNVSASKLQSLLDLALRNPGSASANDPYKEDLKVSLNMIGLTEFLIKVVNVRGALGGEDGADALGAGMMQERKRELEAQAQDVKSSSTFLGYEAFELDYTVGFPLSLIINRKAVLRYQIIFRHLLQLKHLERVLADTWTEHIKTPIWRQRSAYPELEQWKARVFALRSRMFAFVQQMYSFAVSGVLEVNWRALETKLEKVETVDQLLRDHVDFLDTCLNELLLTNEKLLQLHSKLVTVCALFASYTSHFTKSISTTLTLASAAHGDWSQVPFRKQWDVLAKFEQNFNHHSKTNLDRITYQASRENPALLPLVVRLSNLKLNTDH